MTKDIHLWTVIYTFKVDPLFQDLLTAVDLPATASPFINIFRIDFIHMRWQTFQVQYGSWKCQLSGHSRPLAASSLFSSDIFNKLTFTELKDTKLHQQIWSWGRQGRWGLCPVLNAFQVSDIGWIVQWFWLNGFAFVLKNFVLQVGSIWTSWRADSAN